MEPEKSQDKKEVKVDKNLKAEIMQKHLGFLQKIYSGLDEPDGLEG